MSVYAPSVVASATARAAVNVPLEKASISNTPIGPFHKTVLDNLMTSEYTCIALLPISSPIHPSGILSLATTFVLASAAKLSAITESSGK